MDITCGIYLFDLTTQLLLIGHVTNAGNAYSIPKGCFEAEVDEDYFAAALREFKEETNLSYDELNVISKHDLPLVEYPHAPRKLKGFLVLFKSSPEEILDPICVSTYTDKKTGEELPELDFFLWITLNETKDYLSEVQLSHISQISKIIKTEL